MYLFEETPLPRFASTLCLQKGHTNPPHGPHGLCFLLTQNALKQGPREWQTKKFSADLWLYWEPIEGETLTFQQTHIVKISIAPAVGDCRRASLRTGKVLTSAWLGLYEGPTIRWGPKKGDRALVDGKALCTISVYINKSTVKTMRICKDERRGLKGDVKQGLRCVGYVGYMDADIAPPCVVTGWGLVGWGVSGEYFDRHSVWSDRRVIVTGRFCGIWLGEKGPPQNYLYIYVCRWGAVTASES